MGRGLTPFKNKKGKQQKLAMHKRNQAYSINTIKRDLPSLIIRGNIKELNHLIISNPGNGMTQPFQKGNLVISIKKCNELDVNP